MLVDRVHANMEPVERAKVMAKWLDRDHRRQLDERGRRPVLVLTDLCSSEWAELRLGDLNLQVQSEKSSWLLQLQAANPARALACSPRKCFRFPTARSQHVINLVQLWHIGLNCLMHYV